MKILLITLLLLSCQKHKEKSPQVIEPAIAAKAALYKSLHKGWAHDKCDSLGFTSLCKLAGGCESADIFQAEGDAGRWYRSPEKDCYDLGQSASDISKDMFVMLFPYLYKTGNKAALSRIYDYAKANGNVMGRGPISRTLLVPPMILMLQEMLGHLKSTVATDDKEKAGYEKHLDVINWYTQTIVRGGMDMADYEQLRKYVEQQPRNALFQALYHKFKDGNQSAAIAILMDEKLFPSDRLPTATDRCEAYLWQRNGGSDWEPCEREKLHDGVDFLIAAYIAGQI